VKPISKDDDRFERAWHDDAPRLLLYARRHVGADDAQDIVAETFAVAWRRRTALPDPALPWLIGTARNCIRNQQRGHRRRDALTGRLALLDAVADTDPAETSSSRINALTRLASLSEQHREALLLVSWDGLTIEQAAEASGVSAGAFRVRLHRARRAVEADAGPARRTTVRALEETP
jgi:RNA polymerase sigma factor (sigma-70 family)